MFSQILSISAVASFAAASVLPEDIISKTEELLSQQCGPSCVNTFHNILPDIQEVVQTSQAVGWKSKGDSKARMEEFNHALRHLMVII